MNLRLPGNPATNVVIRDLLHLGAFLVLCVILLLIREDVRTLARTVSADAAWREHTTSTLAKMEGRVEAIERLVVALAGKPHD